MTDIKTVSPDQLPPLAALPQNGLSFVFEPGGPIFTVPVSLLAGLGVSGSDAQVIADALPTLVTFWGAQGDGVTDDTAAIQAAINALPVGGALFFPAGVYRTTAQLVVPPGKRLSFYGEGPRQSTMLYGGANTTNDCFVFGDGVTDCNGYTISGLGFLSDTVMTAGAGVRFNRLTRSIVSNCLFSHQDGNANFYHAVWFDELDNVVLNGFQAQASQDGVRLNGGPGGRANLLASNGKIASCSVGLHCGGDFGGLYVDSLDIINNGTNVLIDQAIASVNNREVFFGPGCFIDTASPSLNPSQAGGIAVDIQDTSGFVFFRGTWIAFCGTAIRTGASFQGAVQLDGGIIFKCLTANGGQGKGLDIGSSNAKVFVNGTLFQEITNEAVDCAGQTSLVVLKGPHFTEDVGTPVGANILARVTDKSASRVTTSQTVYGKAVLGHENPIPSPADGSPAQTLMQNAGALGGSTHIARFANDPAPARLELSKSRSATGGGQVAVQAGDELGSLSFGGSDGAALRIAAEIRAMVSGAVGSNSISSGLEFLTRLEGDADRTRRMAIMPDGQVILDNLPVFASNAAAVTGGVALNGLYRTSAGELRVRI